ncbi:MAG: elongation factor G [Clostridiales bacterium]|nr:elongation factor G [Clostridiales bacterium]
MRVYASNQLRNVALLSHGGAGKTSLAEAMLYDAGHTTRLGKTDDGTTVTDYLPEEIKRQVTVSTTLAPVEWKDSKINILDSPGYADFIGEVKSAMRACDGIIMVVDAVGGIEVMTEIHWEDADERNLPRFVFLNKLDRENADFAKVLEELRERFGNKVVPMTLPIGAEDNFSGVVHILQNKAYKFEGNKAVEIPVPADLQPDMEKYKDILMEAAAEGNDDLLMKYLEGEPLTDEEINEGLLAGVKECKVIPLYCGSATKNIGVQPLMDDIVSLMPSPVDVQGEEIAQGPLTAIVFKALADPFVGKINYLRILKGTLKADGSIHNITKEKDERYGALLVPRGKNQDNVSEAKAGDIIAIAKFLDVSIGDTLGEKGKTEIQPGVEFPEPTFSVAVNAKSRNDEDKMASAINKMVDEDPTLHFEKNPETKESVLTGMGETQLDIVIERLKTKYSVEVVTKTPRVPYRETIRGTGENEYKHKKQSGGHGQYGHVKMRFYPYPEGDFEFTETIFGGSVPKNYHPAVEKGVKEVMAEGVLAGYPMTQIKAELYDGSYHDVDSSEMSFKIAASQCFKKGVEKCKPVLMEPIQYVEVHVPEQYMGDIISDLNGKRGRILGMEPHGKWQVVKAMAPLSEMYRYAIDLKSITQGRAYYAMNFDHYEDVPAMVAQGIIAEYQKTKEDKD